MRRGIAELSDLSLQVFDPSGLMWDLGWMLNRALAKLSDLGCVLMQQLALWM